MKQKLVFLSFLFLMGIKVRAQFFSGYGVTIGGTRATQLWNNKVLDQTDKMKYRYGFNGSFFLEMFSHPNIKWISELQYNQKGAKEIPFNNGEVSSRTTYISFNNFLKYRLEGYEFSPYVLAGPRVEYLLSSNGPVDFVKLHSSISVGLGSEFNFMDPWILFTEFHFNPDISRSYKSDAMDIKNRTYELRIGIKYNLLNNKDFDSCPPVYL